MRKLAICAIALASVFVSVAPAFAGCPAGTTAVEVGTTVVNGTTYVLYKCIKLQSQPVGNT